MSRDARAFGRNGFFFAISLTILAIVLIGFAPTLYLRLFFDSPPVPLYVILHGIALTAWFALLAAQATLVRTGRIETHRRLGMAGAVVAAVAAGTGLQVTFGVVRRAHAAGFDFNADASVVGAVHGTPLGDFLAFVVWVNLANTLTFVLLVTAAVALRRHAAAHKRLMLLASISFLPPAIARIARWGLGGDTGPFVPLVLLALLAAVVAYDWRTLRRVHAATLAGVALIIGLSVAAQMALHSPAGRAFVDGLG